MSHKKKPYGSLLPYKAALLWTVPTEGARQPLSVELENGITLGSLCYICAHIAGPGTQGILPYIHLFGLSS